MPAVIMVTTSSIPSNTVQHAKDNSAPLSIVPTKPTMLIDGIAKHVLGETESLSLLTDTSPVTTSSIATGAVRQTKDSPKSLSAMAAESTATTNTMPSDAVQQAKDDLVQHRWTT